MSHYCALDNRGHFEAEIYNLDIFNIALKGQSRSLLLSIFVSSMLKIGIKNPTSRKHAVQLQLISTVLKVHSVYNRNIMNSLIPYGIIIDVYIGVKLSARASYS